MKLKNIFRKEKLRKLTIDDLPEPPKYEDFLLENYKINPKLTIDDLPEVPEFTKVIDLNSVTDKLDSFSQIISSKKADMKRVMFVFMFVLMIYFLFLSVLPGNEKILLSVCAADDNATYICSNTPSACSNTGGCDLTAYGNSGDCTDCTYWNVGGSGDCSGDANCLTLCCGDDTGEARIYRQGGDDAPSNFATDSAVDTCCDNANDCVENYQCTARQSAKGTIPQRAYCWNNIWYGGDNSQTSCDYIVGPGNWYASVSLCCGDDGINDDWCDGTSYNACVDGTYRTEADSYPAVCECGVAGTQGECDTNAESGCWDSTTSDCCGDDTGEDFCAGAFTACYDATYRDDGDYNSYVCGCGGGFWSIGGEVDGSACCENDAGENRNTRQVDPLGGMDAGYSDDPTDDACCSASTDCVNESVCYTSGSSTSASIDQDSDTDYCFNGEWYDCQSDSDCPADKVCSLTINDCVDADGYIRIRNFGTTGIEQSNQDYTSTRSVLLELNYSDNAESCRYGNGNLSDLPDIWTPWEPCIGNRVWLLTENAGQKYVFYEINYSQPDRKIIFNDSIFYNFTGAGLDETPPNPPIIVLDSYINSNQIILISWYNASDPESEVLDIPLRYEYKVFNNSQVLVSGITTSTSVNADISSYNFPSNTILYVNVTVINSAGMTATDGPETTVIDLEPPYIWPLSGEFQNLTNGNYQSFTGINENMYVAASTVNFTWSGQDDITITVDAYSYILTQNPNTNPDNIPEGSIGSFDTETYKKYNNLGSGKYYFKVKSRDLAGNWGTLNSINFSIDSTAPSRPNIKDQSRTAGNITITWYASTDPETNIANYNVSLFDSNNNEYNSTIVSSTTLNHTFVDVPSGSYTGKVKAKNTVGLWSIWSDEEETVSDNMPPIITATPNSTTNLLVVTRSPIIRAWTNEQAVCYYNSSSGDLEFPYSNTTYHETKILNLNDQLYSYKITCIDPAGNIGEGIINFIIDSTKTPEKPIIPGNKESYEDLLTTFTIQVQNSTDDLAGITSDRFTFTTTSQDEIEFSVFDRGTGYYNVSFYAPSIPGDYTITVRLDSDANKETSITLTVKELYLAALFEDSGINPSNTQHITLDSVTDGKIGLASNTPNPNIGDAANKLNMSNIKLEDELFIFNTKSNIKTNNIENILEQQNFLSLINPSFGYKIDDKYIINFILRYDNFAIRSEIGSILRRGQYNTLVRNTLTSSGDKIMKFTRSDSDSGRIVLQD